VSAVDVLETFLRAYPEMAADPLAPVAMAVAVDIDSPATEPNARASCTSVYLKVMTQLRLLVPEERAVDKVDDLKRRRESKLRKSTA
jgi:hypothetical protein